MGFVIDLFTGDISYKIVLYFGLKLISFFCICFSLLVLLQFSIFRKFYHKEHQESLTSNSIFTTIFYNYLLSNLEGYYRYFRTGSSNLFDVLRTAIIERGWKIKSINNEKLEIKARRKLLIFIGKYEIPLQS